MSSIASVSFMPTATSTSTSSVSPSCISIAPGKNGYVPATACNSNYMYNPSFAGALVFAIIFGITTFAHIFQAVAYKRIRLCWVIIMGAAWEFTSFSLRVAGSLNQQSTGLASWGQLLFLLAPMWINAFDYMVLGRMIYFFVPEQQIWGIKGIKLTKIFVWLDVLSFVTQVAGGLMSSSNGSSSILIIGTRIYMGGIGLQQFCILIFTAITTRFFIVMRRKEQSGQILELRLQSWRPLLYVLYASLALITTRIIFRLVEFTAGDDPSTNPIPYNETYVFCLDALPMFMALSLMNIIHPNGVLKGEGSEFPKGLTRKEKKEVKSVKKGAERLKKKLDKEARRMKKNSSVDEYV